MSETTSAPTAATAAEAVTESKPVELVTLHHPTIPDVVTPPLPPEQVEDALRQGWLKTPPGEEQLAEVVVETGPANAPAAVETPASGDTTTPATPPVAPVSTEKPGRAPRA